MAENSKQMNKLPIVIGIVIIAVASIIYIFYKGGLQIFQPSQQQVIYTGSKTIVENQNTGIEMSPTNGALISGLMHIVLTKSPPNTAVVWFGMVPKSEYTESTAPNLGFDPDGSNGWSLDFNTKDIVKGDYTVFIVPQDASKNPISRIFVTVTVQN